MISKEGSLDMKKKIYSRIFAIFLAVILLSMSLILFAGAEASDASDGTAPATAVWQITHKDGTVEYSDSFKGGFSKISDGDVFKLLPKTYNVYLADYANVRMSSAVNITIDLRGTTIIAPETGDVNGQIFNISDSNKGATVNVLMENATIYAAPGGRCAFSVGGYTVINIDGGEDGGKIYAGGALNLTSNYTDESTYSTVKNMYCYKSTPNMAGMICSRNTSKLKLVDTYAVGGGGSGTTLPLYVRNSGCMILENSHGISLNGSNVLEFVEATDETSFTLSRGSTLYGIVKGMTDPSLMKIAADTRLERDYSATLLGDSYILNEITEIKRTVYTSSAVGEEISSEVTLVYSYSVVENITLEDTQTSSSVWKLEGGGAVKYASSLSALNTEGSPYVKATLLCDIRISEATVIDLPRDLEIDFAGKTVTLSSGADVGFAFIVNGSGNLTLELGTSKINLIGAGFLRANNKGSVKITSSGMLAADVLVSKTKSDATLSIEGGSYLARFGNAISSESTVQLKNLSVTAKESGTLVASSADIKIDGCTLIAKTGECAISTDSTLFLASKNYVSGKIYASDITVGDYSYFTEKPVSVSISTPLIAEQSIKQLDVLSENGGTLSSAKISVTFAYYTREYILSDTKQNNSVWMLTDENGNVKYTDHIYTPFVDLSKFVNYTLLCDLNLAKNFALTLVGDIKIDLGSNKIALVAGFNRDDPLFDVTGDGVIEISATGAIVDASGATFARADEIGGITLSLGNSFICADTAVTSNKAPINAAGGYYSVKAFGFVANGAQTSLTSLTAYSETNATLVSSTADVSVNEGVVLVATNKGVAINTTAKLMVVDGIDIFGTVTAAEFYSGGAVGFAKRPSFGYSNMLVVEQKANKSFTVKKLNSAKVTEEKSTLSLAFSTVNITDNIKVSMHLSSYATLNVYVPTVVVNSDPSFTARIVLDGLLYEAHAADGTPKTVDGKAYVRFSYPYVYPNAYDKEAKITLLSAGFEGSKTIGVSSYLERAMQATASDEVRSVIASYAAYSAECAGVKLSSDSPFAEPAKKLTVYHEADADLLFDYFRAVRYEPGVSELRFTPWTSCDYTVNIAYKFGETDMNYTFNSKDGAFAIPVYRFPMSGDFTMAFTDSKGTQTLSINLYDLANFAEEGSDTRLLLTLYLAYANALGECVIE